MRYMLFGLGICVCMCMCAAQRNYTYINDKAFLINDSVENRLNVHLNKIAAKGNVTIYIHTIPTQMQTGYEDSLLTSLNNHNKNVVFVFVSLKGAQLEIKTNTNAQRIISNERSLNIAMHTGTFFNEKDYNGGIEYAVKKLDFLSSPVPDNNNSLCAEWSW